MRDVKFDEYGALIHLDSKTGTRTMRVAYSVPDLGSWIEMHPDKNNKDAYVWINIGSRSKGMKDFCNINTNELFFHLLFNKNLEPQSSNCM